MGGYCDAQLLTLAPSILALSIVELPSYTPTCDAIIACTSLLAMEVSSCNQVYWYAH